MAANKKELKALITLAGKVDPSLQSTMLKAANASGKAANKMAKDAEKANRSFGSMVSSALKWAAGLLAITALVQFGGQALQLASDLQEVQNVVDVTFSQSSYVVDEFADRALESFGLTTLEAKRFTGTMGAMLKSMGLTENEALVMSQNLSALSGDIGSFYNLSGEEAFAKIRSGISGETEPLKQLGINMSVTNLQAYALTQGITGQVSSLSQAEQAMLRYNYLLSVTADAQGDFTRTQGSYANQLKLLKGNFGELSAALASGLMPVLADGMIGINGLFEGVDSATISLFAGQLGSLGLKFMPLVQKLLPAFGSGLAKIMPVLSEAGETIIPPLVDAFLAFSEAVGPILQPALDLIMDNLPFLSKILSELTPIARAVGEVFAGIIGPSIEFVNWLLSLLMPYLDRLAEWMDKAFGTLNENLSSGKLQENINQLAMAQGNQYQYIPAYAQGGFASSPSIFGEAGLEVAIPIQPGNARSLSLFKETAELLRIPMEGEETAAPSEGLLKGPSQQRGGLLRLLAPQGVLPSPVAGEAKQEISLTYAPVIHTNDPEAIEPAVKRGARWFQRMLDDYMDSKGRLCWE